LHTSFTKNPTPSAGAASVLNACKAQDARVPGGQPLPILGDYTDTVVVTVHY